MIKHRQAMFVSCGYHLLVEYRLFDRTAVKMEVLLAALFMIMAATGCMSCGNPPSVSHATVQVSTKVLSGTSVQIATYTCDSTNGYATRGNNTIACLTLHGYAIWTAVQVTCVRVRCNSAPHMDQTTNDYTQTSQRSRSTSRIEYYVYYSGYYYNRQQRSHYAYSRQYYTESIPREVYYTGYVTFTCNSNYFLPDGSRTVRTYCGDQGNWIVPNVTCQGKNCGPLPSMVGVSCTGSSTRYPNRKSCQCITGYERENSLQFNINCQSSGTWSNPQDNRAASCTKVSCGAPPVIQNSDDEATIQTGNRYQDRVTYTCLPGYEVSSGSYSIHCQANKRWTNVPACTRKDCGAPPDIENGGIPRHLYNTTFDSEVIYSCDSLGYSMVGFANVRCSEDGTWSIPPICHKVNCGSPPFVQNSERHVFGHSYNDTVRYECDVGYELVGDNSITCQVIGHWTVPPVCQELSCGDAPEIENTENTTVVSGTTVGSEARYTCITGYEMSGESVIECLTNQQWSTPPQCNRIRCGNPPQIQNGARRVYGHYLNDRTKYQCHTGYIMVGNQFIRCQRDGHWSVPPECDVITCGIPPTPDKAALFSLAGVQFGKTATYRCLLGYITADSLYSICQLNGQWSHPPNCTSTDASTLAPSALRTEIERFYSLTWPTTTPLLTTTTATASTTVPTQETTTKRTTTPTTTTTLTSSRASTTMSATAAPTTTSVNISSTTTTSEAMNSSFETLPTTENNGTATATLDSSMLLTSFNSNIPYSTEAVENSTLASINQSSLAADDTNTTTEIASIFPSSTEHIHTTTEPAPELITSSVAENSNIFTSLVADSTATSSTKMAITTKEMSAATPSTKADETFPATTGTRERETLPKASTSAAAKENLPKNSQSSDDSQRQYQSQALHLSLNTKILIACTSALMLAAIAVVAAVCYLVRRRRTGGHNFVPVSNALYESQSGSTTTVFTLKKGSNTPD